MADFLQILLSRAVLMLLHLALLAGHAQADPGLVSQAMLKPFGRLGWIAPGFEMPISSPGLPIVDPKDATGEAAMLRRLHAKGNASGFDGVIYENRDRDHSTLPMEMFPTLPRLFYSDTLKRKKMDYGLAGQVFLPAIVIGNSSTAITSGNRQRSQPRYSMTTHLGPLRAFLTYSANQLYIYPEHRDHDDIDLFPANWPYMVVTQGSSYSDQPFLRAIFMTIAALKPETRDRLRDKKLIAPTLQMILRRSLTNIYSRGAYLSGLAHPTVFSKDLLSPERMVGLASALQPDQIPPMVQLTVEAEEFSDDAGLAGLSEKLFDTPSAIARTWRSTAYSRKMVVSAARTQDSNGHPLTYSWVLLRGDTDKVRIRPMNNGSEAEISIDWHDSRQVARTSTRRTNRVDIGVFASNGFHDSAPAFISVSFPNHQLRVYDRETEGAAPRLVSVDYDAIKRNAAYDPEIFWSAPWTDVLSYDAAGGLREIRRIKADGSSVQPATGPSSPEGKAGYDLKNDGPHRILSMQQDITQ